MSYAEVFLKYIINVLGMMNMSRLYIIKSLI